MNQAEAFELPPEMKYEDESGVRVRRRPSAAPTVMSQVKVADRRARRRAWTAFSVAVGLAVGTIAMIVGTTGSEGVLGKPLVRRAEQAQPQMTVEMPGIASVVSMTTAPAKKPKAKARRR